MTKTIRVTLVAALTVATLGVCAAQSEAEGRGGIGSKTEGGTITLIIKIVEKMRAAHHSRASRAKGNHAAQASLRTIPACRGNSPVGTRELCTTAVIACRGRGEEGSYLAWQYLGLPAPDDPKTLVWHMLGSRCVRSREPATARPAFVLTLQDFQRLPLPPGGLNIEPGTGPVLINIPTNFYVKAAPVPLTATVLGTRIDVIATPVNYHWTFGDGTTLDTTDPGGPYPHMTTTHTYNHPGPQTITLTTSYTGRYRVAGNPDPTWLPVDGTADVTSPPHTITLIETRAVLVN